jgi:hypothetical protein
MLDCAGGLTMVLLLCTYKFFDRKAPTGAVKSFLPKMTAAKF